MLKLLPQLTGVSLQIDMQDGRNNRSRGDAGAPECAAADREHERGASPVPVPVEWAGTDPETHSFGEVTVNIPEMTVRRRGKVVTLALKEFRMLEHFLKNPGRVIARDELLNEVWGYQNYPCTRTVDNHMLRLRQKLEVEPSRPKHFLTIHSSGYKFVR